MLEFKEGRRAGGQGTSSGRTMPTASFTSRSGVFPSRKRRSHNFALWAQRCGGAGSDRFALHYSLAGGAHGSPVREQLLERGEELRDIVAGSVRRRRLLAEVRGVEHRCAAHSLCLLAFGLRHARLWRIDRVEELRGLA
mmetsp:Transcript_90291/g.238927  ORF Transcript_90291/g.238927 Transcript_90291/m.238927 type:complete len:139 (+) Transcript_90291:84-500(+)